MHTVMRANYYIGQEVKLSDAGLENENYARFRDKTLTINHVAHNQREHPGFDESAGSALYDFDGCPFSLYEWEFTLA